MDSALQMNGDSGVFRTLDDLFDEAARNLTSPSEAGTPTDPTTVVTEKDVQLLSSLDCIDTGMRRICDVKGN